MSSLKDQVLLEVPWYHPSLSRHVAESLLLQNGRDGTYLLRPSSNPGEFAVSIRCTDSVKHFPLSWDGTSYAFGMGTFDTIAELVDHFASKPLIGAESGVLTALKFPYPRDVLEPNMYDTVKIHAQYGNKSNDWDRSGLNFAVASKEGYLTKQGGIVKNWKTRWFVLQKNELKYYREKADKEPVKVLDLTECMACNVDHTQEKTNCFSLTFPKRTYYIYAATPQEMHDWTTILSWKLQQDKPESDL
ncbi:dual adapter for phosphotyrosine and 3-phosphotyrosine and 3-phosphoinositide-like isoform X2 [Tubulanus polymorphus]|uniref:dual adapter for phosphotyrosine and 3-phosphotyrosine and 3-phosphoinositide-like isoform X2 n=1 Tax=Tubulanus polymorphus TaxID=672921 RepID=UPI003DA64F72